LLVPTKKFGNWRTQHSTVPTYDSFSTNRRIKLRQIKLRLRPQAHLLCIIEETHENTYLPSPNRSALHDFSHRKDLLLSPKIRSRHEEIRIARRFLNSLPRPKLRVTTGYNTEAPGRTHTTTNKQEQRTSSTTSTLTTK
jgi:hypothetical protein